MKLLQKCDSTFFRDTVYTSNQCWLAGQVHLVTTRFSTGE